MAANKAVSELEVGDSKSGRKRGSYTTYSPKDKAKVGNYALQHGVSSTLHHFKKDYPNLKWSTVNDWKEIIKKKEQNKVAIVTELQGKKRGCPSILREELSSELKAYIHAIREGGGTAIVMAAGTGIVQQKEPGLLSCT